MKSTLVAVAFATVFFAISPDAMAQSSLCSTLRVVVTNVDFKRMNKIAVVSRDVLGYHKPRVKFPGTELCFAFIGTKDNWFACYAKPKELARAKETFTEFFDKVAQCFPKIKPKLAIKGEEYQHIVFEINKKKNIRITIGKGDKGYEAGIRVVGVD